MEVARRLRSLHAPLDQVTDASIESRSARVRTRSLAQPVSPAGTERYRVCCPCCPSCYDERDAERVRRILDLMREPST
jgi:hypothetical protein